MRGELATDRMREAIQVRLVTTCSGEGGWNCRSRAGPVTGQGSCGHWGAHGGGGPTRGGGGGGGGLHPARRKNLGQKTIS
jgi:hypothetical protein